MNILTNLFNRFCKIFGSIFKRSHTMYPRRGHGLVTLGLSEEQRKEYEKRFKDSGIPEKYKKPPRK